MSRLGHPGAGLPRRLNCPAVTGAGMPGCRAAGLPECGNARIPECRNAGMPEPGVAGLCSAVGPLHSGRTVQPDRADGSAPGRQFHQQPRSSHPASQPVGRDHPANQPTLHRHRHRPCRHRGNVTFVGPLHPGRIIQPNPADILHLIRQSTNSPGPPSQPRRDPPAGIAPALPEATQTSGATSLSSAYCTQVGSSSQIGPTEVHQADRISRGNRAQTQQGNRATGQQGTDPAGQQGTRSNRAWAQSPGSRRN
ncbi:hypothetical protein J2Y69_001524 [Microbacterium resistens]|uniref:Uncharacterized protein n=1 Tax=Microbacterium resistens TaxID=156977 RepID=A0ABU1SBG2_9MICO|nr:hypothetical protein [Microbacterium resistens]